MRTTVIFRVWLIAIVLLGTGITRAESTTFTGKGSAVIIEGDEAGAARLASKAAMRKAASRAMESLIQKGTKDEINYNLKKAELLGEPHPFVESKKTISKKRDGKLLTIKVEIKVDEAKLSRFLEQKGVLAHKTAKRKKADFPSVMVILVEEIGGKINRFPFSSRLVTDELLKKEFDVVDEAVIRKSIKHDRAVQGVLRGESKGALSVALQYGAGILITGKTVAQKGSLRSGGMQAYGANVALQAIHADSGRVIASVAADGSYPHIEPITGSRKAIEAATNKAVARLLKDIEKSFEYSEEVVLVSVSGINFAQLAILKKILVRDFKTISSIKQKSYAGGVAKLNIKINSSPENFSESVALKDFGTFRLHVLSFSPRKIDFVLKIKKAKH